MSQSALMTPLAGESFGLSPSPSPSLFRFIIKKHTRQNSSKLHLDSISLHSIPISSKINRASRSITSFLFKINIKMKLQFINIAVLSALFASATASPALHTRSHSPRIAASNAHKLYNEFIGSIKASSATCSSQGLTTCPNSSDCCPAGESCATNGCCKAGEVGCTDSIGGCCLSGQVCTSAGGCADSGSGAGSSGSSTGAGAGAGGSTGTAFSSAAVPTFASGSAASFTSTPAGFSSGAASSTGAASLSSVNFGSSTAAGSASASAASSTGTSIPVVNSASDNKAAKAVFAMAIVAAVPAFVL